MQSSTTAATPHTASGMALSDIAEFAHNCVGCMYRALREDSKVTPWGMLSPGMQRLLLKCVEAIADTSDLPLLALMNGFYGNNARLKGFAPPAKKISLSQYTLSQRLVWNTFHSAAKAAIYEPGELKNA